MVVESKYRTMDEEGGGKVGGGIRFGKRKDLIRLCVSELGNKNQVL